MSKIQLPTICYFCKKHLKQRELDNVRTAICNHDGVDHSFGIKLVDEKINYIYIFSWSLKVDVVFDVDRGNVVRTSTQLINTTVPYFEPDLNDIDATIAKFKKLAMLT